MTGAVVFLVATRVLVFANDIAVVIVDGKATRQTDLGMTAHAQPIDVESRRLLDKQRCRGFQPLKVLHPRGIDIVSVKIGSRWKIDLRSRHVEKAQRISGGQCARFICVDNVVGNRRDTRGRRRRGTKRSKRSETGH